MLLISNGANIGYLPEIINNPSIAQLCLFIVKGVFSSYKMSYFVSCSFNSVRNENTIFLSRPFCYIVCAICRIFISSELYAVTRYYKIT
ncbi:DUF4052 family protein [Bacillus pacificus]